MENMNEVIYQFMFLKVQSLRTASMMHCFRSKNSSFDNIPSCISFCMYFSCSRFFMRTSAVCPGDNPRLEVLLSGVVRVEGEELVLGEIALANAVAASIELLCFLLLPLGLWCTSD